MNAAPGGRLGALFAIDLRSLAALRVLSAATMLWCLCVWAPDLGAFFTDAGVAPREILPAVDPIGRFSILKLTDGWAAAAGLWAIGVAAALALLVGWRSRAAAFVAWLVYLSFAGRNPLIVQGGDTLLPLLLFWSVFLPIGAVFSVDAALDAEDRRSAPPHLSIATVGLLLQVLYVYVFGALLKTSEVWAPHGSAVYIALHIDTFATPLAHWFRQFLLAMQLLTFFVFWIELLSPALLFFPDRRLRVRSATLALLVAMHLGFRIFLHIGHFWLASLSSLCAFIPGRFWDWLARAYWRKGQGRIEIYYDRDCGFCLRMALVFREFFLPRAVPIRPAQDDDELGALLEREVSWIVVAPNGERLLHWRAVAFVARQSPLLAPIGWLASLYGAIGLGRPTYDLIGRNRRRLSRLTRAAAGPAAMGPMTSALKAALGLIIAFAFLWNVQFLMVWKGGEGFIPKPVEIAGRALGQSQTWTMFAPAPPAVDGYPILAATTAAGEVVDLFRPGAPPVDFAPVAAPLALFPSHRWRAFYFRAWGAEPAVRAALLTRQIDRLCRAENRRRAGGDRIAAIEISMAANQTMANFAEKTWVDTLVAAPCAPAPE